MKIRLSLTTSPFSGNNTFQIHRLNCIHTPVITNGRRVGLCTIPANMHIFDNIVQFCARLVACEVLLEIRPSLTTSPFSGNNTFQIHRLNCIHTPVITNGRRVGLCTIPANMHIFDNRVQPDAGLAAFEQPFRSLTTDFDSGNSALEIRRFVYIHATIICTSAGWGWVVFWKCGEARKRFSPDLDGRFRPCR